MTATASIFNERSTHHVVLSSGATSVGLILSDNRGNASPLAFDITPMESGTIKTFQGVEKYSDLDMPYESIVQEEWGGGQGNFDFDKDHSMYKDGMIDTIRSEQMIVPGMAVYAQGFYRNHATSWDYRTSAGDAVQYSAYELESYPKAIAQKFTASLNFNAKYITFVYKRTDPLDPAGNIMISICADDAGGSKPGTALQFYAMPALPYPYEWRTVRVVSDTTLALTSGTSYWVKFGGMSGGAGTRSAILTNSIARTTYQTTDGTNWTSLGKSIYFRLTDSDTTRNCKAHFVEYKGGLLWVAQYDNNSPSKLFVYPHVPFGVATGTQTSSTLQDTTRTWTTDTFKGGIVKIMRGTGSDQKQPWRLITGNTANTLSVSPDWDVTPVSASSEYVIIGSDQFYEFTAFDTNYDVVVKDVLAANGALYFANGDSTAMVRMVGYNNAGTWTWDYSDLGGYTAGSPAETGQFSHLLYAGDEAGNFVWGATGGFPPQLYKAEPVDLTGTSIPGSPSLTFNAYDGANGNIGDLYQRITGLIQYGTYGNVHVLKEEGIWQVYNGRSFRISSEEQRVATDYRSGKARTTKGSYLYFAWHDTVFRYYEGVFDNIGPNWGGKSLPDDRRGVISAIVSYPGMLIVAIDGGTSKYSSIMAYNDQGWCTLYVAPDVGMRIQSLYIQSMPGDNVDRLWFSCGADILWMPLSVDPYNHPRVQYHFYPFWCGGILETSDYYLSMNDIEKYYRKLKISWNVKLHRDPVGAIYIKSIDAAGDDDTLGAIYVQDYEASSGSVVVDKSGKKIRFILCFDNYWSDNTPRIIATTIEAVKRFDQEYTILLTARLEDNEVNLLGNPDDYRTALDKYNALITLQNTTAPVTMHSMIKSLDSKSVFVDRVKIRPVWEHLEERDRSNVERYLVEIALIDALTS